MFLSAPLLSKGVLALFEKHSILFQFDSADESRPQTLDIAAVAPYYSRHEANLQIAFANKSLRQICEKQSTARRQLGHEIAEALKRRLADIDAAPCAGDLVTVKKSKGHFKIPLTQQFSLVLSANHNSNPIAGNGHTDWPQVTRVKIEGIEKDGEPE